MDSLISVIVPIYNSEKYLDNTIKSIINQTYKNLEIILVDDGSTDKSYEICKKYQKKDNRIKLFHQKNKGVSFARNIGIENSNGEFLTFMDSDDLIDKKMYEKLFNAFDNNLDYVFCDYKIKKNMLNNSNKILDMTIYDKIYKSFPYDGGANWCLYRTKIIKKYNIKFSENLFFAEDLDFLISYLIRCKKNIKYVDEKLYYYVNNSDSITKKEDIKLKSRITKNYFDAAKLNYYKIINLKDIDKYKITNIFINFIFHLFIKTKIIINKKEMVNELKKHKKYFNLKQKIYYFLIKINKKSLYYLLYFKRKK